MKNGQILGDYDSLIRRLIQLISGKLWKVNELQFINYKIKNGEANLNKKLILSNSRHKLLTI